MWIGVTNTGSCAQRTCSDSSSPTMLVFYPTFPCHLDKYRAVLDASQCRGKRNDAHFERFDGFRTKSIEACKVVHWDGLMRLLRASGFSLDEYQRQLTEAALGETKVKAIGDRFKLAGIDVSW